MAISDAPTAIPTSIAVWSVLLGPVGSGGGGAVVGGTGDGVKVISDKQTL